MIIKKVVRHDRQGDDAEIPTSPLELATQAIFYIGNTTIIASANYQNEGNSCAEKLVVALIDELKKQ